MDSIKKLQEYVDAINLDLKAHEQFLQEDLDDIERLKRKNEIVGLKPIEIEKLGSLHVWVEQERKIIEDLKSDLQRFLSRIEEAKQNKNDSEDEADL